MLFFSFSRLNIKVCKEMVVMIMFYVMGTLKFSILLILPLDSLKIHNVLSFNNVLVCSMSVCVCA